MLAGCWGVCVFVCALCLWPTTPGRGVRCECVSFASSFSCAPPLLAGVVGRVCVCVRAPLVPRHSWLGCAVWVCVLGLGFRLRPATPGWGVGVCVCLYACSACTPPLQAGVCAVGVCAWAGVSAALCHPWLGCPAVCVFVCALRLYPAPPAWGARCGCVCLGLGFGRASPLLAGVLGCVCVCVCAQLVRPQSWLRFAVWVCLLGLGLRLRRATPGWAVGVCVCFCARFACTLPLLAGVRGVDVCTWARISATPRHCWLGCWGVCVFVYAFRLYPATPGWGAWCGCVCLGSDFSCAPPLLAVVLGCVCVCVRVPLVPPQFWLRCAMWVCVLGLPFRLRPANPGWAVGMRVCLCARSPCTPPLLAGVLRCVYVGMRALLVPRESSLGCAVCVCVCLCSGFDCAPPLLAGPLGGVCVCVRTLLVPRHSWPGCAVWVCVLGLGSRLPPATPG